MQKFKSIIWGIIIVAVGIIIGLNALEITDIDIFFDGWWTLFIIIPCFLGLFTEKEKLGSIFGIAIGVFLLLCSQDILEFSLIWKLGLPAIIIAVGLKMIFSGNFKNKSNKIMQKIYGEGNTIPKYNATFSGSDASFSGEVFRGTELSAVFGGVTCDLRNAFIEQDCVIKAVAVFGGIDIYVPEGVNVKVNSTSIFGGVTSKKNLSDNENANTIYVNAVCVFGGVDVK